MSPYLAPQATHGAFTRAKAPHPIAPARRRTAKARTEAVTTLTDMPKTMMHRAVAYRSDAAVAANKQAAGEGGDRG